LFGDALRFFARDVSNERVCRDVGGRARFSANELMEVKSPILSVMLGVNSETSSNYNFRGRIDLGVPSAKLLDMPSTGLRELKKARTRQLIADTAARLFAERGYEHVAVSDVARAAEVAEATLYNYFQTKEQLVTDRDQHIQDRLGELIRSRPPAITPAAAIRDFVLESVAGIRGIPPEIWRGELGYLAAISPTVHRLALELIDRQAAALASAISDTGVVAPEIAKLQGIALASVFQIIISEAGWRTVEGQSQAKIADELYPIVENVLDELDRWLSVSGPPAPRRH
jgi:AcrR family transcriptional regulator